MKDRTKQDGIGWIVVWHGKGGLEWKGTRWNKVDRKRTRQGDGKDDMGWNGRGKDRMEEG